MKWEKEMWNAQLESIWPPDSPLGEQCRKSMAHLLLPAGVMSWSQWRGNSMNVVLEENRSLYFHPYESFPAAFLPTVLSLARCALSNEQCSISKLQQFSQQLQPRRWVCNKYVLYLSCWYGSLCVSMHFIPWKKLRTTTLPRKGKVFPKSPLRSSIQEFPVIQSTVDIVHCLCGGLKVSIRGLPGQFLVRTHHFLYLQSPEALVFLPYFLFWG